MKNSWIEYFVILFYASSIYRKAATQKNQNKLTKKQIPLPTNLIYNFANLKTMS